MKKQWSLLIVVFAVIPLFASERVKINANQPKPAEVTLLSSKAGETTLRFSLKGFRRQIVQTPQGEAWLVSTETGGSNLKEGYPDLPVFATSVIIAAKAKMQVQVVSARYKAFDNVLVAPSKGNVLRSANPEDLPYEFGPVYKRDTFYHGRLARLRNPYILRDFRGQTVLFQPFQYNPVTRTLRVYYELVVRLVATGSSKTNTLSDEGTPEIITRQFDRVYRRHFLNYGVVNNRQEAVKKEEGNMLIVTDGCFIPQLQPLVKWRRQCGRKVEVVDVSTIGGAEEIRQFVAAYYNSRGLTYLLLVGDGSQLPPLISGGNYSDNAYAFVAGNDHYPEFFVGRFSAQDTNQVKTMVKRTIDYEKYPLADTAWYSRAIGIASVMGPGDKGETDYEHLRNIADNKLLPFTYTVAGEFFDGSQGGSDEDGNPTAAMIQQAVNSGAGIINYTGHGSLLGWTSSGFSIEKVNELENTGKLPFIFSAACGNGDFVNKTCFAEVWLRAEKNGQPAGAVAVLMSTGDQSWNPPMRGQDEMISILAESYENNVKPTFAGIAMNGCMRMNDVYGSAGEEVTDTWTVFGDPSLSLRTASPAAMKVSHPSSLACNDSSLVFNCDAEGARATLSLDGQILATTVSRGGSGLLNFSLPCRPGFVDFVVTAFNRKPYLTTIKLRPGNWPGTVYGGVGEDNTSGSGTGLTAFPNPFGNIVNIVVQVREGTAFLLEIRNLSGQTVNTLSGENKKGGKLHFEWDAAGREPGIYFATLKTKGKTITKKLVLLR